MSSKYWRLIIGQKGQGKEGRKTSKPVQIPPVSELAPEKAAKQQGPPARGRPVNKSSRSAVPKSSTVIEVSELSSSIGASLASSELELHHYLSRARASFFFSSEVAYYCSLARAYKTMLSAR